MQRAGPHLQGKLRKGECATCCGFLCTGGSWEPGSWTVSQASQILASKSFSCSMSNNSTHSTQGKGQRGDMLIHFPRAHTAPPVGRLRLPGSGLAGGLLHLWLLWRSVPAPPMQWKSTETSRKCQALLICVNTSILQLSSKAVSARGWTETHGFPDLEAGSATLGSYLQ